MKSPVLIIPFNWPDTVAQVMASVRAARPPKLYVSADGPRPDRPGEHERCMEARRIATDVDWPCEVKTRFLNSNHGAKIGVATAIDWFFDNEQEGIILEHDVVPLPSFYQYADELLDRYRNEPQIMTINGSNMITHLGYMPKKRSSYYFSAYSHSWGWASWSRAWANYDVEAATGLRCLPVTA